MPLAADVWSASTSLTRLYTASGKVHIFSAIILLPLAVVKLNLTVLVNTWSLKLMQSVRTAKQNTAC